MQQLSGRSFFSSSATVFLLFTSITRSTVLELQVLVVHDPAFLAVFACVEVIGCSSVRVTPSPARPRLTFSLKVSILFFQLLLNYGEPDRGSQREQHKAGNTVFCLGRRWRLDLVYATCQKAASISFD